MSHNELFDKGIINIGEALQMNTTLRIFDISHSSISDNGVLTFSNSQKKACHTPTQDIMELYGYEYQI